jgi:hypothetical protein
VPIVAISKRLRLVFVAGIVLFSSVTGLAMAYRAVRFEMTPGEREPLPSTWPVSSRISRTAGQDKLVVFAHPYCSCTHATLAELNKILSRRGAVHHSIAVLLFRPEGNTNWKPEALWREAEQLPGSQVFWDDGGREAKLFGAGTSGSTLLFGADGRLRFHGGVTSSRGHQGDNVGATELIAALDGHPDRNQHDRKSAGPREFFVFGCSLFGSGNNLAGEKR